MSFFSVLHEQPSSPVLRPPLLCVHIKLTSRLSKRNEADARLWSNCSVRRQESGPSSPKRQELKLLKLGAVADTSPRSLMQNKSDNLSHVLLTCTYPFGEYVGAGGLEDGGWWGLGESVGEQIEEECLVFGEIISSGQTLKLRLYIFFWSNSSHVFLSFRAVAFYQLY